MPFFQHISAFLIYFLHKQDVDNNPHINNESQHHTDFYQHEFDALDEAFLNNYHNNNQ